MSRLIKKEQAPTAPALEIKLGVRDTDFLMRLIKKSTFEGLEIEQVYTTVQKLSELHRLNLEG